MVKKIVLVGAGNIGSRHLQALAKLPYELSIDIVEKETKNFEISEKRLLEIGFNKDLLKYQFHQDFEDLKGPADLVIVATNSKGRADLVIDLLDRGFSRFLLEKIVTQSKEEYEKLLNKINEKNSKAWIDTARVYFDSYQKIKEYFRDSGPLHVSVNCGNEGLGCNAIHFINLFSYLCNNYKVKLNGDALDNQILPNKRGNDLVEFSGTITGSVSNGSSFTVTFVQHENLPFTVEILGKDKHLFIEERKGIMNLLKGEKELDFTFNEELQSNLTTKIVKDILEKDSCLLPTLQESSYVHYDLFRIFNSHLKKVTNKESNICPIT